MLKRPHMIVTNTRWLFKIQTTTEVAGTHDPIYQRPLESEPDTFCRPLPECRKTLWFKWICSVLAVCAYMMHDWLLVCTSMQPTYIYITIDTHILHCIVSIRNESACIRRSGISIVWCEMQKEKNTASGFNQSSLRAWLCDVSKCLWTVILFQYRVCQLTKYNGDVCSWAPAYCYCIWKLHLVFIVDVDVVVVVVVWSFIRFCLFDFCVSVSHDKYIYLPSGCCSRPSNSLAYWKGQGWCGLCMR